MTLKAFCECGCGEEVGLWDRNDARSGRVKGKPKRFLPRHYQKMSHGGGMTLPARVVEGERVAPVVGFEGHYEVSEAGVVYSLKYGARRALVGPIGSHGYRAISLSDGKRKSIKTVHRIVLEAFVGRPPNGMVTRHLNGLCLDNRLSNLCYGSYEENMADKLAHGTHNRGERNPRSRLTETDVRDMRRAREECELSYSQLAKAFGVTKNVAAQVVRRETWQDVA